MTAGRFDAFESDAPDPRRLASTLPPDPRMPTDIDVHGSAFEHAVERLGQLSDSIHAEDGLIRRLFRDAERRAERRHDAIIGALRDLGSEQLRTSEALRKLEPEVEKLRARAHLQIVEDDHG